MAGGLGTLAGISGLAQSINTTEAAQRELGTLNVLSENIRRDKQEGLMFQEMEAQEYEQIAAAASELLERDRGVINDKSLELQAKIRQEIGNFGSRKKFFENGGLAMLKKYKTDLLNSPENLRYKDNKTNMERILQLQVAGKGHLLSPTDLRNLQEYQNGSSDKITYSGLMSEIEYPAEFYAFGSEIPDMSVLHYKDNYTRIYGNYVIENGQNSLDGLDSNTIETELLSFMKKMNYKGIGKDEFYRQEEAKQRYLNAQMQKQTATTSGTKEDKSTKMTWLSAVNNLLNDTVYTPEVTAKQLLDSNYVYNLNKESGADYLGASNTPWEMRFKTTATKSGMPFRAFGTMFQGKYFKPASAMKVPITDQEKLVKLSGFAPNEDGTVNYKLDTSLYNANGEKFSEGDVDDYFMSVGGMETEGKAKVLGSFIGFRTEDGKILMNVVDKKGKVRKEDDNENRKAYGESQPKHSMFVAMQGEDDQVFYKEVDITSTFGQNEVSNILAESDDITGTVETRNNVKKISDQSRTMVETNRKKVMDNFYKASTKEGAFGSEAFVNEANYFKSPNTTNNRNNLVKAYYMAYDSFINKMTPFDAERLKASGIVDQSLFSQGLSLEGDDLLAQSIIDYNVGDSTFIKNFADAYNNDENLPPESKQRNLAFAELWNKYYKAILSNNK